MTAASRTG